MKLEQRFSAGLQLLGAFTWSRTIDSVSEIQTQGGTPRTYPQYNGRRDLERGVANYDQTRRFVASVLYELPFGKGKRFLNGGGPTDWVLGGWQANTIVTLADGLPYTIGCYCGDRAQVGNDRDVHRMNVTGNPTPDSFAKTIFKQFDTSVFQTPALARLDHPAATPCALRARRPRTFPCSRPSASTIATTFSSAHKLTISWRVPTTQ